MSKPGRDIANAARIYDYLLGGRDNFPADQQAAEELLRLIPDARAAARQNREFLQRAVGYLAHESGIGQFIDIGSGLPTVLNTHQAARASNPQARTVYVDNDPIVTYYAHGLLGNDPAAAAIPGDLREPAAILASPGLRALIDPARPVAVILAAVLHFLPDHQAYPAVDYLKNTAAPGSYLVISHVAPDLIDDDANRQATAVYAGTATPRLPPDCRAGRPVLRGPGPRGPGPGRRRRMAPLAPAFPRCGRPQHHLRRRRPHPLKPRPAHHPDAAGRKRGPPAMHAGRSPPRHRRRNP